MGERLGVSVIFALEKEKAFTGDAPRLKKYYGRSR